MARKKKISDSVNQIHLQSAKLVQVQTLQFEDSDESDTDNLPPAKLARSEPQPSTSQAAAFRIDDNQTANQEENGKLLPIAIHTMPK